MRTRRNAVGVAVVLAAALAVAGCVQTGPAVIPTSEPSSTPVFASNAAALAAAKKAYAAYVAASDQVAHGGGLGVQRLAEFDSPSQFKRDSKSFAQMHEDGHHTVGASAFSNVSLESNEVSNGKAEVVAYICLQIGGTELLDSSGANVGASRPLSVPLEVSFISAEIDSKSLLVDRSDVWSGTNFCS